MILSIKDLEDLRHIAEEAVIKAGELIQNKAKSFKQMANKMGSSQASSVLTEVDILSQNSILSDLKDSIEKYNLGLLAEESDDNRSRLNKDYFWCIDPMDGTLSFINKHHGYSVAISLISKNGIPYIGIVYDPVTKDLYSSVRGNGVFKNREKIVIQDPNDTLTLIFDNSFYKSQFYKVTLDKIKRSCKDMGYKGVNIIDNKGAVLNALSVIENNPGVYFKFTKLKIGGGAIWDFASTALFFDELKSYGFSVSDSTGKSLKFNSPKSIYFNDSGIIYSSNSKIKDKVIRLQNLIKRDLT